MNVFKNNKWIWCTLREPRIAYFRDIQRINKIHIPISIPKIKCAITYQPIYKYQV